MIGRDRQQASINLKTYLSGRVCQPWSFQYPHRHNKKPEKFPSSGLDKNYCRNPGDTKDFGKPWCYTSDPFVEWEYCDVPKDSMF